MTANISEFVHPRQEVRDDSATFLRELADRMQAGEIGECAIVYNDRENNCFAKFGHFDDRWRLLGALEYAKAMTLMED